MKNALLFYAALETNRRAGDYAPLAAAYGQIAETFMANGHEPPAPPLPKKAAIAYWVDAAGNEVLDAASAVAFAYKDDPDHFCATPVPQVTLQVPAEGTMCVAANSYQDPDTGVVYAQNADNKPIGWSGPVPGFSWHGSTTFRRSALHMSGVFENGMPIYVPA